MEDVSNPSGLAKGFDRIAPYYDRMFKRVVGKLWNAVAEIAEPKDGMKILDICCGTGGVSLELAKRGAEVTGIDISQGMIEQAIAKAETLKQNGFEDLSAKFELMSACGLEFEDNSFDLATVCMALHEMPPERLKLAMSEMARVAKDGIIVADYNIPKRGVRRYMLLALIAFEYWESPNFKEFSRLDFKEAFAAIGLKPDVNRRVRAFKVMKAVPV